MNKKGFTLIELLAVILILGIIALIAIPTVTSIVSESRIKAGEESVISYVNSVEQFILSQSLKNDNSLVNGVFTGAHLNELGFEVKGDIKNINLITKNSEVISGYFCANGNSYIYTKDNGAFYQDDNVYCFESINDIVIKKVSASYNDGYFLSENGDLYQSGYNRNGGSRGEDSGANIYPTKINTNIKFDDFNCSEYGCLGISKEKKVYSWGIDKSGNLGIGINSYTSNTTPITKISTLENINIKKVYMEYNGSLFLDEEGNLYYAGLKSNVIGENKYEFYSTPIKIADGTKFKDIFIKSSQYFAIDVNGDLWAWGSNGNDNALLNGKNEYSSFEKPTKRITNHHFKSFPDQTYNLFVIDEDGYAWTWGYDVLNLDPNKSYLDTVTKISDFGKVKDIATCGYTIYYVNQNNEVYELNGYGTKKHNFKADSISCSTGNGVCLATLDGKAYTFGTLKESSGIGYSEFYYEPKNSPNSYTSFYPLYGQFVGLDNNNNLNVWGNKINDLENGEFRSNVKLLSDYIETKSSTDEVTYFINENNKMDIIYSTSTFNPNVISAYMYDANNTPINLNIDLVEARKNLNSNIEFEKMKTTNYCGLASLGITKDGKLYEWGTNFDYKLTSNMANNSFTSSPVLIKDDIKIVDAYIYGAKSYAIDVNGDLWAWGNNKKGFLGDGSTNSVKTPKKILTGKKIKELIAYEDSCDYYSYSVYYALSEDGTVYTWGYNGAKNRTDNKNTYITTPTKVNFNKKVVKVYTSGNNILVFLTSDNELYAMGYDYNNFGFQDYVNFNEFTQIFPEYKIKEYYKTYDTASGFLTTNGDLYMYSSSYNFGLPGGKKTDGPQKILSNIEKFENYKSQYFKATTTDGKNYEWGNTFYISFVNVVSHSDEAILVANYRTK